MADRRIASGALLTRPLRARPCRARMTALYRPQRLAGLLKRKRRRDEWVQRAVHDELGDRVCTARLRARATGEPPSFATVSRSAAVISLDRSASRGRLPPGPRRRPGRKSRRHHLGRQLGTRSATPGPGST